MQICFLNILYNINTAHNYELIGSSVPEFYEKHKIDKISLKEQQLFQEKIGIAFLLNAFFMVVI